MSRKNYSQQSEKNVRVDVDKRTRGDDTPYTQPTRLRQTERTTNGGLIMMTRRNEYKLSAALPLVAKHGFTVVSVGMDYATCSGKVVDDRLVSLHQDWTPKGAEFVRVQLTRGKWAGQNIGSIHKTGFDWRK